MTNIRNTNTEVIKMRHKNQLTRQPCVALGAGGTGGHLFPAVALAEALEKRGIDSILLAPDREKESRWLKDCPLEVVTIPHLPRPKSLSFSWKLAQGVYWSRQVMKGRQVSLFAGLGGYPAFPPALAAKLAGIPVICLEQNAVPGKVTKVLHPLAAQTFLQWEEARNYLWQPEKTTVAGNPLRSQVTPWPREKARVHLGLDRDKFTILVMGGSQGSKGINEKVASSLKGLEHLADKVQWVHLTGNSNYREVDQAYQATDFTALVRPFSSEMGALYGGCDLILGRSGGTTLAEATAAGIPLILVPYPHAAADHQMLNGRAAERRGAAVVVSEADLTGERVIDLVTEITGDSTRREEMARASAQVGRPEAAAVIAGWIEDKIAVNVRRKAG